MGWRCSASTKMDGHEIVSARTRRMIPSLCEVRHDFRGPIHITVLEISSGRLPVVDVEFTLQRYELGEIAREMPIEIEEAVMR